MSKVGIIGVGHVGSHVASSLLIQGIVEELVLIDINKDKAIGQGFDLIDSSVFYPKQPKIYYNDYSELADADIVVISVAGSVVSENRLTETQTSIDCVKEVLPHLKSSGFKGIILSITNPCDIVANYIALNTDFTVIGSGTTLDSSRFRLLLGQKLNINPNSINAFIIGEHGDSQFPYLSNANVAGIPLLEYAKDLDLAEIATNTKFRATPIFNVKRCTEFGIGTSAAKLIKAILTDSDELLCVSYYVNDYGINDTYLSLPAIVGKKGVISRPELQFSKEEHEKLLNCANIIKNRVNELL